jgi:hypothetical protein
VFSLKRSVWNIEDSEVGPGEIQALVEANDTNPMVSLTLKWISGNEQLEVWQIEWAHSPDYLLDELPEYLLRFCPVANEMIGVLRKLGEYPKLWRLRRESAALWQQLSMKLQTKTKARTITYYYHAECPFDEVRLMLALPREEIVSVEIVDGNIRGRCPRQ